MPTDSQFLDGTSDIQRLAILRAAEAQGTYVSPLSDNCFKDATEDMQRLEILRAIEGISGGGSGTVTSITAGTGLTGGTITTSGTIAVDFGTTADTVCEGNDSRLSNARTPTAHASTHAAAGSDPITVTLTSQVTGTLPVANGGTGVTISSGANSVVLRDANNNITANAFFNNLSTITASGTQVVLTAASAPVSLVAGSGGQTIKLPDATTLTKGTIFSFNNNQSSGAILVNNNSNTLVVSIPSGGYVTVVLLDNATAAGSWDRHDQTPSNVSWSTNTLDYPGGSITNATWNGVAVAVNRGGTGASTAPAARTNLGIIEITEAAYAALTPAQVNQTATYIVKGSSTQNSTSYVGKEFGGSKPVSLLAQPVVVGNASPLSTTINSGSVDWVQASPFDANKFYFSQNIGGGALAAMWRGTLTKDSANRISGGTNSYSGQQALTYSIYSGSKGGGIYDADTVFIPDEKYSAGDASYYGRIVKVDLTTSTTSDAWNFQTSTPAVVRADIASQIWAPEDCIVDRANNKLFVSSTYASATTEGSSIARFSIDPTTKALTPDSWVKAVTSNGSGICYISRMTLLPDGYIFVTNYNYTTNLLAFQSFNAYGSASGNAASVGISFATGNLCQGVAFKPDTNAPSGIGYILIALRAGADAGKIYAFDYQGAGVFNTTATDTANLTTIAKSAGLWTNSFNLEIGSISVTADGSILCGIRGIATTPIPRAVIAFNWIPYAKSGTLSTQNLDNVNILGGSISGVRNITPKIEYINSTRYWYKDDLAKYIRVQAWGAGGGGGSGRKDSSAIVVRSGGSGGGGGAYVDAFIDASLITSPVTVTIGGGGNGGASQTTNATNGNNGTAGGTTAFANFVRAIGGALGGGGTNAAVTGGVGVLNGNGGGGSSATGAAGSAGSPIGTTATVGMGGVGGGGGGGLTTANATSAGGAGGNSYYGATLTTGTAGTAGGGAGGNGNNTTNGTYQVGTGGGGGGSNATGDGGAGGNGGYGSGGGGGGASQNGNSGAGSNGGNGFMIVTTFY
jgi:hypothetical protein